MESYCQIHLVFVCDTNGQSQCKYFEQDRKCSTPVCKFGLPNRECFQKRARARAASKELKSYYERTKLKN